MTKQIKKVEWQFEWHTELKDKSKEVYKLTTVNNTIIIQGLISIEDKKDHVFMHLIESAKFNKGKKTKFILEFQETSLLMPVNFQLTKVMKGFLLLTLNQFLLNTMEQSLHATHFLGLRMFIEPSAALRLISQYFKT